MSFMHIVGNAECGFRMEVSGLHIVVIRLVFLLKFSIVQERLCVQFDSTTGPEALS